MGVKRGWWKSVRNGDLWVFVASIALIGAIYEADPEAIQGGVVRKGLGFLRGEGWIDRVNGMKRKIHKNKEADQGLRD